MAEEQIGKPKVGKRLTTVEGSTYHVPLHIGHMWVIVNSVEGKLYEVFINAEKTGTLLTSLTEAIGRLISIGLRSGIPAEYLIDQMKDIFCGDMAWMDGVKILSIPDGIAKVMEMEIKKISREKDNETN